MDWIDFLLLLARSSCNRRKKQSQFPPLVLSELVLLGIVSLSVSRQQQETGRRELIICEEPSLSLLALVVGVSTSIQQVDFHEEQP